MNQYEFIYNMTLYFTFMALILMMISAFIMYVMYNHVIDTWFSDKGEISYDTWAGRLRDSEGSQGSQGSPGILEKS